MTYTFSLHAHRFAVWTAARAVARDFTGTKNIKEAIEETNLAFKLEQLACNTNLDPSAFDAFHKEAVNAIMEAMKKKLGSKADKATYGRTAKIVAIYIKTRHTILTPTCGLSKYAHPPIDSILLENLSKDKEGLNLRKLKWTKLDEENYFRLIHELRQKIDLEYFWELEQYWSPS